MADDERELLARIEQLAGQINRRKNQQSGAIPASHQYQPAQSRHNTYHRYASAPYPTRGHWPNRGRPHQHQHQHQHQHRTLHFNNAPRSATAAAPPSYEGQVAASGAGAGASGWVARNDRHRQLINASVFEKESQSRTKAIEETWRKRQQAKRRGEKARLSEYLRHRYQHQQVAGTGAPSGADGSAASVARNEIMVGDIRFRVLDGGKKLARVTGDPDTASSSPTPKSTVIAGVKFHRTKTGNLVVHRVVKDHRRSGTVKKIGEPCKTFSSSGSCPKGPLCRYTHDPDKVALCKEFLKEGKCALGDGCDLSHDMTPERVPNCLHYAKGHCTKAECPFTHSRAAPTAPVCRAFGFLGYCEKGADCVERHVFECPDFSNTGRCNNKGCKLPHRERASMLRGQNKQEEMMEDVSSDDEPAGDSDDVDSDEVAEFIDADSDASDVEDDQDFISV